MVLKQLYWAVFWAFTLVIGLMFIGFPIIMMEGAFVSLLGIFISCMWTIAIVSKIIFRLTVAFSSK